MAQAEMLLLAAQETRRAWRNRYFLIYAGAFTVLALGVGWLSNAGLAGAGAAGLGRTAASLIHLVLLAVPLMGLTLGAGALAGERERGVLLYLMSHPINHIDVALGKLVGLSAALLSALLLGFGLAAVMIAQRAGGDQVGAFLGFLALTALLAAVSLGLGLLISAFASTASTAVGLALAVWFGLTVLGDLGLMGTTLATGMSAPWLLTGALANPLQVFKLAALLVLRGGLEDLGPAGLYATQRFGEWTLPLLVALLFGWILATAVGSIFTLRRRGVLP